MTAAIVLAGVDAVRAGDCEGCNDYPCNDGNGGGTGLCCADLTGNGVVDDDDLAIFLEALLLKDCDVDCSCPADLNHDGVVDDCDMCIMEHEYETCAGYPPLLFETWNSLCYCDDPNCPTDPNDCCPVKCSPCLADQGCLPLEGFCMTFSDLDADDRPDALVWALDSSHSVPTVNAKRRRIFWNEFEPGIERWVEGCFIADIDDFGNTGRGFTAGDFNGDGFADVMVPFRSDPNSATDPPFHVLLNFGDALRCGGSAGCGSAAGQCSGNGGANFFEAQDCYGVADLIETNPVETGCLGDVVTCSPKVDPVVMRV